MDTPERSKAGGTPASKFEDSPVFNFINSLSPIQPVKSVHGAQAFHSLSLASISSIFSSPHVNSQKESRFLIRQPFSDSSKHEASSDIVDESSLSPGISNAIKLINYTGGAQENCNITCSLNEATVDPPDESSTQPSNLPQSMQYDCGSPNHNTVPCFGIKLGLEVDVGHTVELPQIDQDGLDARKNLFSTEIELRVKQQLGQEKEAAECDWENLISDDLLIFDSSTESEACKGQDEKLGDSDAKSLTSFSSKLVDVIDISHNKQPEMPFSLCLQNAAEDPPLDQSANIGEQHGTDCTPQILSSSCQNQVLVGDRSQKTVKGANGSISSGCKQPRGMRRRCLVFEVAGVSRKSMHNDSNLHPSMSLPSNGTSASDDKQSIPLKPVNNQSPRVLPGIGLHLNALATTSKDRMVSQESLASGRRIISMPCSISPFPPIAAQVKSLDAEKGLGSPGREVRDLQTIHDDASEAPALGVSEELSQSSPKKKRRKPENGGESEACKRCNCKKSKCLKLYCECFAAGVYCVEPCSCQGCFNKPIHEETVLTTRKQIESRNPLAFAPKVIRASDPVQDMGEETNKTPASARHKRGCNCKKSSCLKKYCECYQGGVGCSGSCRCEGCKNAFGRKDAMEETEHEEEEMDGSEKEKDKPDEGQQNANAQKSEHRLSESILPITPSFQICRPSVKLPFISTGKPPRSSTLSIGYSISQMVRKCDISLPQHKIEENVKNVSEDDTPEILKGNASPSNGVKTASPNRKRVSPPHIGTGMSPNRKGGRKLILKSIPSFPSLGDVSNEYPISYSNNPFNSSALS